MNSEQDIFSKLVNKAKTAALTEREKATLFASVDSFVKKNPLPKPVFGDEMLTKKPESVDYKSPVESWFTFLDFKSLASPWYTHGVRSVVVVVVIMVFGLGGTSWAAQNSLPGDFLYPVMVNINEGVKVALLSGSDRVEYEVERIKNRIEETKELALLDRLSPETSAEVTKRLDSHVARVQKDIENLEEKGEYKVAFDINSDLEKALKDSEAAVAELPSEAVSSQELASIEDIISKPLQAAVTDRENTENKILTLNDAQIAAADYSDEIKAVAESKFESVQLALQTLEAGNPEARMTDSAAVSVMSAASIAPVSAKAKAVVETSIATDTPISTSTNELDQVRALLKLGQEKLGMQAYTEALGYFKEAYNLTQEIEQNRTEKAHVDPEPQTEIKTPKNDEKTSQKIDTHETATKGSDAQTAQTIKAVQPALKSVQKELKAQNSQMFR